MSNHITLRDDDYVIDQNWKAYTADEHAVWDFLYRRQVDILKDRADPAMLRGLETLNLNRGGIPNFSEINVELKARTGFEVVAVPGLVPDEVFFNHLANRRFPAGQFIRTRAQLDYLQEPDIFHDVFGHVPLLTDPVFADYMEAYGKGGLRAIQFGRLKNLAALYWYTVEFGLIETPKGVRIYGAGISSSKDESIFALEDPSPNRIRFDLERVMRTGYRIDDFQQTYFVIRSYDDLFRATVDTDFAPLYGRLGDGVGYAADDVLASDGVITRGTQAYAKAKAGS
ncbi:MAG: phenylalanine 4-monooxygenase [Rhodobacterales bacterium 12-64-8]|nr:MAG: phenylalanine 4-monooxygenase [Rhodobacterales bacterium 12-64-8]OYX50597.1 MAG: phenylalanine 4-monooxygenase [Alphaproteobacteria bacterium 32-64-14]